MLCLGCELDRGGGGRGVGIGRRCGSDGCVGSPGSSGLKGDRTVFGLRHAGSAVLFK